MKRVGFTLIELLVVIAIISILAAIIFPAAMRAKDAAYRSSDMSHLNELRSALQLYRVDQGGYPPELFTTIPYSATPPPITAADQTQGYLYPKRVSSLSTFQPGYDHANSLQVVGGINCGTAGNAPCVYWPGPIPTGSATCNTQAYGYNTVLAVNPQFPVTMNPSSSTCTTDGVGTLNCNPPQEFYLADGYDVAPVLEPNGATQYESHYALFWTGYGLGSQLGSGTWCTNTGASTGVPGSASDQLNQLGYNNPPDSTVITWDTFFRDYTGNVPTPGEKRDVVLFIGGNAKMYDSATVANAPWNFTP
ncbi:MAG TPA: prepilin-type N-terminal cleavage/methylation domain-containing protein [Fimbriimonadaceae bacterium]|jgi:prepilin-type N-terminal cleavage/methylation domain-containing protein